MTATGRGARGDNGAAGATVRGAVLVAVAVVVGVVLLAQGFDNGTLPTTSPTATEAASDNDDDNGDGEDVGEDASTTTTATPTTHPPAGVRVQVLNGGGPTGSAGASSQALAAAQYVSLDAADTDDVPASIVYYADTFQADAVAIATLLNITAPPEPLPAEAIPNAVAAGQVDVLVILGPGFAAPG